MATSARRAGGKSHRPSFDDRRQDDEQRSSVSAIDSALAKLEGIFEVGADGRLYLKFGNARKFEFSDTHFKGRVYHQTDHAFAYTGTSRTYVSFVDGAHSTTITDTGRIAKCDGQLVRVVVYAAANAGSTVVSFHTNWNTTPVASRQLDLPATTYTAFDLTDAKYTKHDSVQVGIDPTNNAVAYIAACVWRDDTRTL